MSLITTAGGKDAPRIYAASLSDYNAGTLHGAWLEAIDADAVHTGIQKMLKASPEGNAEEFAIHDYEGFGSYSLHEYESIDVVCAIGAAIAEHGTLFASFLGHIGSPKDVDDVADALERFTDSYQGAFDSLEDWAEQFLDDTGALKEVPESLRPYIDFEKWARDADMNGDVFTLDGAGGQVHVFWSNS